MKMLGYDMCMTVWDECSISKILGEKPEPKIIFLDGGINEINPFSINTHKNEFNVYCECFDLSPGNSLPGDNAVILNVDQFFSELKETTCEIYMDMNGSMAFYNGAFKNIIPKIKILSIMGGVETGIPINTMSTMPFLNRFGSSTMNQLYSKNNTKDFLQDIIDNNNDKEDSEKIKIMTISNNEINRNFFYCFDKANNPKTPCDFTSSITKYTEKMKDIGLIRDNTITKEFFDKFYKGMKNSKVDSTITKDDASKLLVVIGYKPFDVVNTLALIQYLDNSISYEVNNTDHDTLYYFDTYGTTIIGKGTEGENLLTPIQLKRDILPKGLPIRNSIELELDTISKLKDDKSKYITLPIKNKTYTNIETIEKLIKEYMNPSQDGGGKSSKVKVFGRMRKVIIKNRSKYVMKGGELVKLSDLQREERRLNKEKASEKRDRDNEREREKRDKRKLK